MRSKFKMFMAGVAALATAGALAAPAAAQSYDALADFAPGSNFVGGFGDGGTTFTAPGYTAGGCAGSAQLSCYSPQANVGDYTPTALKNNGAAPFVFNSTLSVPTDYVLLHPGSGANVDGILRFTATVASIYQVDGNFLRLDTGGGNSVIASVFLTTASNVVTQLFTTGVIADFTAQNFSFSTNLGVGDSLSFAVNNNGDHTFDSTGLQAAISAVPETSTWAMMILGLGMVGGALRRRAKPSVAVSFG